MKDIYRFNSEEGSEGEQKDIDTDNREKTTENIKELGETRVPQFRSNIHCITIIGQIEGHIFLPPQNKATKYEHIIP